MSYVEFSPNDNIGYTEINVLVKVKTVGAYLGDGTSQQLKDSYQQLLESGELSAFIEEYLNSKILGEQVLDWDDCHNLGLVEKLVIKVE